MNRPYSYDRRFYIQAAHFNAEKTYHVFYGAREAAECERWKEAHELLLSAFKDVHGHNFIIDVKVRREKLLPNGFVVDDWELEKIVLEWDNQNLSIHSDFMAEKFDSDSVRRISTELMADVLSKKVVSFTSIPGNSASALVEVRETHLISASAYYEPIPYLRTLSSSSEPSDD